MYTMRLQEPAQRQWHSFQLLYVNGASEKGQQTCRGGSGRGLKWLLCCSERVLAKLDLIMLDGIENLKPPMTSGTSLISPTI